MAESNAARTTFGATQLLWVAESALASMDTAIEDLQPGNYQALVVAVFAGASVEAMINDIQIFASKSALVDDTGRLNVLSKTLSDMERMETILKMNIVHLVLTGLPIPKGNKEYRDLEALIDLRNHIMHLKPERSNYLPDTNRYVQSSHPGFAKVLEERKVVGSSSDLFANAIMTKAMARWACDTARAGIGLLEAPFQAAFETSDLWFGIQLFLASFTGVEVARRGSSVRMRH